MPRTANDRDTIIRLDRDKWGPHMHYGGKAHLDQQSISGSLIIANIEAFAFVEAVQTVRQSGCSMEEILFFTLKGGK